MEKTLFKLSFLRTSDIETVGYYKKYNIFTLFLGRNHDGNVWHACMQIGNHTVMIPGTIDDLWLNEFDNENSI